MLIHSFLCCIIHVWLYLDLLSSMLRVLHLTVLEKMKSIPHMLTVSTKFLSNYFIRHSFRVSNLLKEVPSHNEICFIYLKHDSGMSKLCLTLKAPPTAN